MHELPGAAAERAYTAGAASRIYEEAWTAARGDARTALALLQGCYVEMAMRLAQEEQPSGRQLETVSAFCRAAGTRLLESATTSVGTAPQLEGATFAMVLRNRFETAGATRRPDDDDLDGDPSPD
jgi:hypothetical protein